MDRAEASRIAHGDLRLWNPPGEAALDEVIGLLDLPPGARVPDVACGRGEVLRRTRTCRRSAPRVPTSCPTSPA